MRKIIAAISTVRHDEIEIATAGVWGGAGGGVQRQNLLPYHTGMGPGRAWPPPARWHFGKYSRCWNKWRLGGKWRPSLRAKPAWRCTSAWWTAEHIKCPQLTGFTASRRHTRVSTGTSGPLWPFFSRATSVVLGRDISTGRGISTFRSNDPDDHKYHGAAHFLCLPVELQRY